MDKNIIDSIRSQVAADIRLSPTADRLRIGTPLTFDDGDACSFFLIQQGEQLVLSDLGDIFTRADYQETDLRASGHRARFDRLLDFYGMREDSGQLVMAVAPDKMGGAIFSFAQASLELVRLARTPADRKKRAERKFRAKVGKLVRSLIPANKLDENWYDREEDPNKYYPVDYRIHGTTADWWVFGVGTSTKCLKATVTCQHYRLLKRKFRGVAIYKNEDELPKSATAPLDEIVERKFTRFGDDGAIAAFLENELSRT